MPPTKKKSFQDEWLRNPIYENWIERVPADVHAVRCTICSTSFGLSNMGKEALDIHISGKKHQKAIRMLAAAEETSDPSNENQDIPYVGEVEGGRFPRKTIPDLHDSYKTTSSDLEHSPVDQSRNLYPNLDIEAPKGGPRPNGYQPDEDKKKESSDFNKMGLAIGGLVAVGGAAAILHTYNKRKQQQREAARKKAEGGFGSLSAFLAGGATIGALMKKTPQPAAILSQSGGMMGSLFSSLGSIVGGKQQPIPQSSGGNSPLSVIGEVGSNILTNVGEHVFYKFVDSLQPTVNDTPRHDKEKASRDGKREMNQEPSDDED